MKIVLMKGGLGNQLFQLSFALLLSKTFNEEVKLDFSWYHNNYSKRNSLTKYFGNKLPLDSVNKYLTNKTSITSLIIFKRLIYKLSVIFKILVFKSYYFEFTRSEKNILSLKNRKVLNGYWQSKNYIDFQTKTINKLFGLFKHRELLCRFISSIKHTNSVFVGVRRGDYLSKSNQIRYGLLGKEYYLNSFEKITSLISKPIFYIFSDDVEWCKENFKHSKYKVKFIDFTLNELEDFEIMRNCNHAIISNSTFNWWAARLIKNKYKIIVRPKYWFNNNKKFNLFPNEWLTTK